MRKSVLAMAAVAAMGAAGAANAGWFTIQSASVLGSSLTTPSGTYTSGNSSPSFAMDAGTVAQAGATGISFSGGSKSINTITQGDADAIVAALGITGNGTVAYFGFDTGGGAPAYFGVAMIGNGTGTMDTNMANAHLAANGVYTNSAGPNQFFGNTFQSQITTTAGTAYVFIFAGLATSSTMGAGTVSDSNFNVQYLSHNGTSWGAIASANAVSSSSLNFATYAIPVPAPMLLAGAGLIGAAALRRRVVKRG